MSWPAVPEELLAGPRGRNVCFEAVSPYHSGGELEQFPAWFSVMYGSGSVDLAQLADELAVLVAAADLDAVAATEGDTGLLGYVAEAVTWAMYWQSAHRWQQPLAADEIGTVLEPVARAVTAAPAARWWSEPVERERQQYTQFLSRDGDFDMEPPALTGAADRLARWRARVGEREQAAARLPSDPAANYSDWWWSTPALAGLVCTTRSVPGLGALRLLLVEDSMGWPEALCWPLAPRPAAKVYEVREPRDWAALVRRYPLDVTKTRWHDWFKVTGRAGTWLIPDYTGVAADYDGVHLTVGGYLTTAGRALALDGADPEGAAPDGAAATMLAGWDPDLTYWLTDVLEPAGSEPAGSRPAAPGGQPVRWVERDGEPLGWAVAK